MADSKSIRLIFEYNSDHVELILRQSVEMIAPATDSLDDFEDRPGSWVEVRDVNGVALHRQVLHEPIGASTEVFGPGPTQSLRRVDRTRERGAFTVVVPDLVGADRVTVVADMAPSPGMRASGSTAAPVRKILHFSLHETASDDKGQP